MEAVIFIGIQAAGKSTFYLERFFHTHLRISYSMLRTRRREQQLVECCLRTQTKFVVDNTNPVGHDRARYILPAKAAGFGVSGYYFATDLDSALNRNRRRPEGHVVPEAGVRATYGRLEIPRLNEGFDRLFRVTMAPETFRVESVGTVP
jgi:predicted ABC-type ATPase